MMHRGDNRYILLDSNVWIAFFYETDSQHHKAQEIFALLTGTVILPEYIILEICTILTQRAGKKVADTFIHYVIHNRSIQVSVFDEKRFYTILDFYSSQSDEQLSFVDTALLFLSQEYLVVTFDKRLSRAIKRNRT